MTHAASRAQIGKAFAARCGGLAVGALRRLPAPCTATAKRRRFLFLGLCTPGFVAVATYPFHKSLEIVVAGLVLGLLARSLRTLSEPHFAAHPFVALPSPEPSHD
jgi:hypothetical protein